MHAAVLPCVNGPRSLIGRQLVRNLYKNIRTGVLDRRSCKPGHVHTVPRLADKEWSKGYPSLFADRETLLNASILFCMEASVGYYDVRR